MIRTKELSTAELKLFRQKMISVYDNNSGKVKVEASLVLSMIEGELLERGVDVDLEEELSSSTYGVKQWFSRLKAMLRINNLVLAKK